MQSNDELDYTVLGVFVIVCLVVWGVGEKLNEGPKPITPASSYTTEAPRCVNCPPPGW